MSKWFDKGNAGIFAATTTAGQPFVISLGLKRNAESLDPGRVTSFIEYYAGDADA
jgi:dihydroneopterin aldolase